MAQLRPAVNENDNFLAKIIKYIPAEIITVYTAIQNVWKGQTLDTKSISSYFTVLIIILVVTPLWTYFATIDNPNVTEPPSKQKRAIFHASVATISFIVWLFALNDQVFNTMIHEKFDWTINAVISSVVLILYTGLLVPLAERIILKTPVGGPFKSLVSTPQDIIDICDNVWDANKSDCNAFVKAVSSALKIPMSTGDADAIVDFISDSSNGFTVLQDDTDDSGTITKRKELKAKEMADLGKFVIGGLKGKDNVPAVSHGHVVVVVSGDMVYSGQDKNDFPKGYWGTLGGVGKENESVAYAFNKQSIGSVTYAYHS